MKPQRRDRQHDRAALFRDLHAQRVLILPNAWDAGSAAVIAAAGAPAIATTSAGISWSLGRPDGENLLPEDMLAAVARIAAATDVPVSADIESGYGGSALTLPAVVEGVIAAGAVGINLEDSVPGGLLRTAHEQAELIASARETASRVGVDIWINARTDVFLSGSRGTTNLIEETLTRGEVYAEAGADSLFVPGINDVDVITTLVKGPLPVNVMVGPGAPTVAELTLLGVRRISVGMAITQAAYGLALRASRELLEKGTYLHLEDGFGYKALNSMMR